MRRAFVRASVILLLASDMLCLFAATQGAEDVRSVSRALSRMLILDNGRIKPLDTYARHTLYRLSGRYSYKRMTAVGWLCPLVFGSTALIEDAVFLMNNPEAADALGITPQKKRRYSLKQLMPAFERLQNEAARITALDEKERSIVDNELLRTTWNVKAFLDISATFSFAVPQPDFSVTDTALAAMLGIEGVPQQLSYYDLIARFSPLNSKLREVMHKEADTWTASDSAVVSLSAAVYRFQNPISHEKICIVPIAQNELLKWLPPFDVIRHPGPGLTDKTLLEPLVNAARLYNRGSFNECAQTIEAYNAGILRMLQAMNIRVPVQTELLYNTINPFFKAYLLYLVALGFVLIGFLSYTRAWPAVASGACVLCGFLLHTAGLVLRMLIMHRPPVTTLYETFVFVAWMCVLLGMILQLLRKNSFGMTIASFMGLIFLYFAGKFGADGDTMGMLAPILNNNFWLTTHIMTISMGYAGCFAAGVLAHIYLVRQLLSAESSPQDQQLAGPIYAVLAFGLTLTTIGTVLGGLWADQAWGRFWGWDPKENGALLIILWCASVFHARAGGFIKDFGFACGAVVALNLVMIAWIGVNLLGIGLHAYGFTTTGAKILFWVVTFESVFMIAVVTLKAVLKSSDP